MAERDLRADSARAALAEYEYQETAAAFEAVREALLKTLAETPVGQDAKILNLHKSLQNLAAVREALMHVIRAGQVADHTLAARDAIAMAGLTRP